MAAKHAKTSPNAGRARPLRLATAFILCAVVLALALVGSAVWRAASLLGNKDSPAQEGRVDAIPQVVEASLSGWVVGADGIRRYYDPATHRYYDGWLSEGDAQYYIDGSTGEPKTGWLELNGKRYWLDDGEGLERGRLHKDQWLDWDGGQYYLTSDGSAATGWLDVDELRRYFDETGRLQTGLITDDTGTTYYIKPDTGEMAIHEWIVLDGVFQAFDDDGSLVTAGDIMPPNDAENVANMTERQRAVVDSCDYTPWAGFGLCAAWVSNVFVNAGEPSVGGDACDIARAWCHSSDLSELKPGMIIAVPSHPRTDNGKIWGHVCVYVGNGMARDNGKDSTRWVSLATWFGWYGVTDTPQWGWANGIALD